MRPTLAAFALMAACAGHGKHSPEGEVYWACVEYYEAAIECGTESDQEAPEEVCGRLYDLTACDDGGDPDACARVEDELAELGAGMDRQGLDLDEIFAAPGC